MNYKDWTIPRLKELPQLRKSLDTIPMRLEVLEAEYTNIRATRTDATPVRDGTNGREEMLVSNIAERQELERTYKIAKQKVKIMDDALAFIGEPAATILDRFYIHKQKNHVERLSRELGFERSSIYRMKDEALVALAKSLYGIAEE